MEVSKSKLSLTTLVFLILNFSALGIGAWLMGDQVTGEWYTNLNKAPWTPPGWVFGFAWTIVMLTFSVFMALLYMRSQSKIYIVSIFLLQFVLNFMWNGLFFKWHLPFIALIEILVLFLTIILLLTRMKDISLGGILWGMPYLLWLLIAISLNAYVVFYN